MVASAPGETPRTRRAASWRGIDRGALAAGAPAYGERRGWRGRAGVAIARAAAAAQELGRTERVVHERAAGRAHRDAEVDLGVDEALDDAQAREELAAQHRVDERGRELEVPHEDLAVEAAGGDGAEEGALEDVVLHGAIAAQLLGERGDGAVHLDGDDEAAREVDAVRAPVELGELQRAGGPRPVQRAQQIAEGRRSQSARKLHPFVE